MLCVFFVDTVGFKEARRRQLFGIAHNDHVFASGYGTYGFTGRQLAGFVKDDQIKLRKFRIDILRHRDRAHQHTRAQSAQQCRDLVK